MNGANLIVAFNRASLVVATKNLPLFGRVNGTCKCGWEDLVALAACGLKAAPTAEGCGFSNEGILLFGSGFLEGRRLPAN